MIYICSDCGLVVGCSWCNQFDYVDNPVCRNIGKCPNNAPFDGDGGGLGGSIGFCQTTSEACLDLKEKYTQFHLTLKMKD